LYSDTDLKSLFEVFITETTNIQMFHFFVLKAFRHCRLLVQQQIRHFVGVQVVVLADDQRHHALDEQGQLRVGGELRQLLASRDEDPLQALREIGQRAQAVYGGKLLSRSVGKRS
jgi:hypothetical protein